ncbi:MAG: MOSC domain-containing protein, partial [Mesorhizobium sp.]
DEIARPDREAKWHKVPRIRTRLSQAGRLEIAIPDGRWLSAPGAQSDRAISAYLGFAASIRPFRRENAAPDYAGPLLTERYVKAPIHL